MAKSRLLDFNAIKKHARELRCNMTESEKVLWKEIKNRKLAGYKFLRQHPVIYKGDLTRLHYFVADFYCNEKKAVIELDGPIHNTTEEYDQFKDSELQNMGIQIIRIKNEELNDIKQTLRKILAFLNSIN